MKCIKCLKKHDEILKLQNIISGQKSLIAQLTDDVKYYMNEQAMQILRNQVLTNEIEYYKGNLIDEPLETFPGPALSNSKY